MSEKNPFKQVKEDEEKVFPDGVRERLEKQAERTNEAFEIVLEAYEAYIKEHYECNDWKEEDDDLLVDWAEQFGTILRSGTAGAGLNTTSFVGEFLGVHAKTGDRRLGLVGWMKRLYKDDPNAFIANGRGGVYEKEDGKWVINHKDKTIQTDEDASEIPSFGIPVGSEYICFVSRAGNPYPSTLIGRYTYFLGNEQEEVVNNNNILLWRVDLKGEDVNRGVKIGEPCVIKVRKPAENAKEQYQDILDTNEGFIDTINYTDEWLPTDLRPLLHPFRYWVMSDFSDLFVPLHELRDAYDAGLRTFKTGDGEGKVGPFVITRGTVNRMSREGRETEWDENGVSYSLMITSSELQSTFGSSNGSNVLCNISSACHDLTHPFTFRDDNEERWEYAEKSTVLVFGRIGMMIRDGTEIPKIAAMGIYTDSRRARPRINGGDTNLGQFD